jgi:nucleoside-diphosphate-sugar epimerase
MNSLGVVAVTGASGFIGRQLAAHFVGAGFEVRALSRMGRASGSACLGVDYTSVDSLIKALQGVDTVIHAAGLAHVEASQLADADQAYREANVAPALNVARACIGSGVRHMVLLSSAGVMGKKSPKGGFEDSMTPAPYDAYSRSKLEADLKVAELAGIASLSLTLIRPPMVYGPGAPGSFRRLRRWISRDWPVPLGAVSARRSFIGARNLCSVVAAAAKVRLPGSVSLLVADSAPMTAADFSRTIAESMHRRARIIAAPPWLLRLALSALGRSEEYRRIGNAFELVPSRARALLDWVPPYSTLEELRWTVAAESAGSAP